MPSAASAFTSAVAPRRLARRQHQHALARRHRAHAVVKRQPPAGARRHDARAIVVGEGQVLIVRAGGVEVPARHHPSQPRRRHHCEQASLPVSVAVGVPLPRRRPRGKTRSPSRRSRAARPRVGPPPPSPRRARGRPASRAASPRAPPARRRGRRAPRRRLRARARRRQPRRSTADDAEVGALDVARALPSGAAGASGNIPEPPIWRTSFRNSRLPTRVSVISVWWSMPSGNSQSAARSRSTSALGNAFCRSQRSPARTGVMQARRLGRPSMRR